MPDEKKKRSRLYELTMSVLRIAVLVYLGLCVVVYFRQSSYVYYPEKGVGLTPEYFKLTYEDVRLTTEDGQTIAGWFVPAQTPGAVTNAARTERTVLFCHGNGGSIEHRLDAIASLARMGLNVMIFDYRGYGDSTGDPTEEGTYLDARAAWQYLLKEKGFSPGNIVVFGESLGGSVAAWLSMNVKPGALVIESTFTRASDMAVKLFPYLPIRLLCKFKYDTVSCLGNVGCPVLVAHSRDDEMIPFAQGRRNFEAAKEPKVFVEMRGGHNSGGLNADPECRAKLRDFVLNHLDAGAPGNVREKE